MALSSQPVAGVDVADRQREKGQADGEHDDVQHFAAPCPMQAECMSAGHMNSRGPRQPRYRNLIKIGREEKTLQQSLYENACRSISNSYAVRQHINGGDWHRRESRKARS